MPKSFLEYYREVGALGSKLHESLAGKGETGVALANAIIDGLPISVPTQMNTNNKYSNYFSDPRGTHFTKIIKASVQFSTGVIAAICKIKGHNEPKLVVENFGIFRQSFTHILPPIKTEHGISVIYFDSNSSLGSLPWGCYYKRNNGEEFHYGGKTSQELSERLLPYSPPNGLDDKKTRILLREHLEQFDENSVSAWKPNPQKPTEATEIGESAVIHDVFDRKFIKIFIHKNGLWVTRFPELFPI